ncbi:cupin domain-containing protein [Thermoleophilia bacterium SCSIO 60948]|nr:cupin domain-containing protein [Thermoleophilia bacterium SCSIO 60948]
MTEDERFFGAADEPAGASAEPCSEISLELSDHAPGQVAGLHRHPYEEAMLVQGGRARYAVGDEVIEAGAGELVIVPPGVWHGFEALGDEPLRQIGLGATDDCIVEWRDAA